MTLFPDPDRCREHGRLMPCRFCDLSGQYETEARARTTDPHTSHAAARSLIPSRIRRAQAAVLRTLTAIGPCTDHELVEKMGLEGEYVSPSGIRTRRSELVILGRARDTGKLAKSAISNRQCILWEAI